MAFTLKHCIEMPNGTEKEYITTAKEVSYRTTGSENTLRGIVYCGNGDDMPTQRLEGPGKVYVMNDSGKTVATYWLGPVETGDI